MAVKNIDTILILGATSGLGEAFTHYFHSQGKKVLAAGCNVDKLASLKSELKGLETFRIDVEDIANLDTNLKNVIKEFPGLDSVFVFPSIMNFFSFKDPGSSTEKDISSEVTTNLTAPILIARTVVPLLLPLNRPATLITVSSGLRYIPVPIYPVYVTTKAGIRSSLEKCLIYYEGEKSPEKGE